WHAGTHRGGANRGRISMTPASVVICTHNRAAVVGQAIASALAEVRAAGGEVLVVDNASSDDTPAALARVPRPGWLAPLLSPYADARVACVGGRIVLRFPTPPPSWLTPPLHGSFSAFDLGPSPKRLRYRQDDYPYGANISFRADTV